MKFSDFFIPKWQHSNPAVRVKAVADLDDIYLLSQIAEKDENVEVCQAARSRIESLQVTEVET